MQFIEQFVKRWNKNIKSECSSESDISDAEKELGMFFPNAYKEILKKYGEVYTPDILEVVCDLDLDIHDVQNIMPLAEAISCSRMYQSGGMPEGFFTFANDCMGNMFCLKAEECQSIQEDAKVWFFDHDYCTVVVEADSIKNWLEEFIELEDI